MNNASKTIFVGNIPYDYDEETLLDTLKMVGPINSFRILYDEVTNKPKGYGFCVYTDPHTATSALRNLKTIDYNGRQLRINYAENDKTGVHLNEDDIRACKEITYVKESEKNNELNMNDYLNNLSDEQKYLLFCCMKNLSEKDENGFYQLLNNQSEEFLEVLANFQNEFLLKMRNKNMTQYGRIIP